MKKLIVIAGLCAMVLTACSDGSPKSVAESYVGAVQKGDWKAALELTDMEPEAREFVVSVLEGSSEEGLEERNRIEKFEVTEEQISQDGLKATVHVNISFADGHEQEQEIELVKGESGKWLVADGGGN